MSLSTPLDFKHQTAENHNVNPGVLKAVVFKAAGRYIVYADKSFGPTLIEAMKKKKLNVGDYRRWHEANSLTAPTRGSLLDPVYFGVEGWSTSKVLYVTT